MRSDRYGGYVIIYRNERFHSESTVAMAEPSWGHCGGGAAGRRAAGPAGLGWHSEKVGGPHAWHGLQVLYL